MVSAHVLIVFICVICRASCFNIDTKYPIIYFYNNTELNATRLFRNTHFGYSVILYKGVPFNQSWIQIGAPKANDTNNNYFEPGAVFRCPIGKPCHLFPIDDTVDKKASKRVVIKDKKNTIVREYQPKKDEAWIGGSMDIDMRNDRVVVCGHRWINNNSYANKSPIEYAYHITGACYWFKSKENVSTELLPITGIQSNWYTNNSFVHSKGQAGSSVHFPLSNTPELLLGTPGVNNWKGTVIRYADNAKHQSNSAFYSDVIIPEPKDVGSFNYFGYATTSGYFFSPAELLYVAGAPRAEQFRGKIVVFSINDRTQRMRSKDTKVGTMTGEYFGAAIAVADINGDRLDDIIVGAPRHSLQMDEGRIYIYYGSMQGTLRQPNNIASIIGKAQGGQFGSAVQSLGDLDSDGCADIAVGAPYEDDNHGVVYIYNGQFTGDSLKLSQRIQGKSFHPLLKGFGISFSRPTDIDGNNVDDVAIGSYLSENAVVLRSRPVVVLNIKRKGKNLNLDRSSKQFQIEMCLSYKGKHAPQQLNVTRKLKMDESNQRVYVLGDRTRNTEHTKVLTLNEKREHCENITFGLTSTASYLDPIVITASLDIVDNTGNGSPLLILSNKRSNAQDDFCKFCPIVKNAKSTKEITISIPYTLNCGSDNKCESDLRVQVEFQNLGVKNKFIIGSQPYVSLKINVTNKKEDAYLTQLEVKLPENVRLQEIPTNCNEDLKDFAFITCDVDNPLKTSASKIIVLNFDMSLITNSSQQKLSFNITTKSKSAELNETDNSILKHLDLGTDASIEIKGNSEQDVYYFQNKTTVLNATHLYKVQKLGVSPLNYFKLNVSIPVSFKTGNGAEEKFMSITQPIGVQGEQSFFCSWYDLYSTLEDKLDMDSVPSPQRNKRSPKPSVKNTTSIAQKTFIVPITNKVAFINCSMANVVCKNLICEIGPFQKTLKVATLQIKMKLDMTIVEKHVLMKNKKSIIYLSTDGSVKEISGHRSAITRVSNVFLQPVAQQIALWIIIVSIIAGILILLLIILGLVKVGFFKRKTKEELELRKQKKVDKDFEIKEDDNEDFAQH